MGGTGQDIWVLDELDRVDKHQLLIAVAGAHTALVVDFGEIMVATFPDLYAEGQTPKLPMALRPAGWTRWIGASSCSASRPAMASNRPQVHI
jgi:hypothetical protein